MRALIEAHKNTLEELCYSNCSPNQILADLRGNNLRTAVDLLIRDNITLVPMIGLEGLVPGLATPEFLDYADNDFKKFQEAGRCLGLAAQALYQKHAETINELAHCAVIQR